MVLVAALASAVSARAQEPYFDVRDQAGPATPRAATRALERRLGPQAVVDVDPVTRTPRVLARLNGALSGPARGSAAQIGLRYVREHLAALGLDAADLDTLQAPRVTTAGGVRQVRWRQAVDGVAAADSELRVNVDADGRVLSVLGAPAPALPADTTPALTAGEAVRAVQDDVGVHRPLVRRRGVRKVQYADGTDAELTLFTQRLAWRVTYRASSDAVYDVMVDAKTGKVLRRVNMIKSAAQGLVWENHPGAPFGGQAEVKSLPNLAADATTLNGPYVHAWMDLNDNDEADAGEEVAPDLYDLVPFGTCSLPCTWNPGQAGSWETNRLQSAVQAFYLANRFRDHLAADPIRFDEFQDEDKVLLHTNDGANTGPDGAHLNNANMFTPREGQSPVMQMYLWRGPHRDANSADDASTLFHEYAHGLSGRLVQDPGLGPALNSAQAGAMGEGWSDYFAKDFLVQQFEGLDTTTPNEVKMGVYLDLPTTSQPMRKQGLDCPVGNATCPGRGVNDRGGFTYGDFGKIVSGPEVHFDGEIWAETLWDLRTELGPYAARRLITNGMRLAPPEPSFLDARNAILIADAAEGGANREKIWKVFARRGMGFFAHTIDGNDTNPLEDFSLPPNPYGPRGTIAGRVTEALTGAPIEGAQVSIGGNADGPDALAATTDANGEYELRVPPGAYATILVRRDGYDRALTSGTVAVEGTLTVNVTLRRDWASVRGGAKVISTAGQEYESYGCGPGAALDGNLSTTWSTDYEGASRPKPIEIELPEPVDITGFGVDPTGGCGDDESASTAQYTIEVAATPGGYGATPLLTGTFTSAHHHRLNLLPLGAVAKGIRYVRFTPRTPWGGGFLDVTEFTVYGHGVPKARIESGPDDIDSDPTPTFTFSAPGQPNATFSCAIENLDDPAPPPPPVPCTSPFTPAQPLTSGRIKLEIVARNALGSPADPTVREWTLRTDLPDTEITTPAFAFTRDPRPLFTISGPNPSCTWDGVEGPCVLTTDLPDGEHTFEATAHNDAGADPTPARRRFTVDTTAPKLLILGTVEDVDSVTFAFAAPNETDVTFRCRFDGIEAPCKSPKTYMGLANGRHTFVLIATDAAGNAAELPPRFVDVAVTEYDTKLEAAPAPVVTSRDVNFAFSSVPAGASFECSLDGAPFAACDSPLTLFGLADGAHRFEVRAVSASSRRDATPASVEFIVDATPPDTTIDVRPLATLTTREFTFVFSASEPASFLCRVDGGPATSCSSPFTLSGLADGEHSLEVTAVDLAGLVDPEPARVDFRVQVPISDAPTPTVTPTRPAALKRVTIARTLSLKSLRRSGRLRFRVSTAAGARVTVSAKLGSKTLAKGKRKASGPVSLKINKRKLRAARVGASITLRIQATGSGLISTVHTAKIKLRR